MEHRTLKEHFAYLVEKGFPPSIIRRKMALDVNGYNLMAEGYIRANELKLLNAELLLQEGLATEEELQILWREIEQTVKAYQIEEDIKTKLTIEKKLDELSIKYAETLVYKKPK